MNASIECKVLVASIQQNGTECKDSLRRSFVGEVCTAYCQCCLGFDETKYGCLVLIKHSNGKSLHTSPIQKLSFSRGLLTATTQNTVYCLMCDVEKENSIYDRSPASY